MTWKLLTVEAMSMVLMEAVSQAVGNNLFYCWESGRSSVIAGMDSGEVYSTPQCELL